MSDDLSEDLESSGSKKRRISHTSSVGGSTLTSATTTDQTRPNCRVFISYSHKDGKHRDRLEKQLKSLKNIGYVKCWSDNQIRPTNEWHSAITEAMESANLFLLLISQDFVTSEFIMQEELPYATKRAAEGSAKVLPILLRPVNWKELHNLNKWQALPSNLRAVTQWENDDECWLDIEVGIIEALRYPERENLVGTVVTLVEPAVSAMSNGFSSTTITSKSEGERPLHFSCLTDFWKEDIQEGKLVSFDCTLSRYAPLVIGAPFKKRDAHLKFRKMMSGPAKLDRDEAKINSLLSFTAAQMVWSMNFASIPWRYFGLYQSIVRNSIPLFVKEEYYKKVLEKDFHDKGATFDAKIVGRVTILPKDFTELFTDKNLMGTKIVKPTIRDGNRPIYGIVVGEDEQTSIIHTKRTPYLDGDIWVLLKVNGMTSFYTRFCNVADDADVNDQVRDLKEEIDKIPSYDVVFQFDQLQKPFEGKQIVEVEDALENIFD